ncbi:MAG: hypothetical protein ACXW25_06915 [Rhodospirillales bacterium]
MVLSLVEPVGAGVRENRGTASAEDLRRIIHKAILARQFAAVHKQTVRQCLRAARVAARRGENDLAVLLLGDARAEHAEVQACVRVARVLERQAEEMGKAAGVYRATGRAGAAAASDDIAAIDAQSAAAISAASSVAGSPATRRTLGGSE